MTSKKLSLFAIVMMNVVIVASLQIMTATAVYGYALFFCYLIAAISFLIPCILIISELATAHPITGGSYIWVEKALGKKWGFFAAGIQWLCNLIWYPTIFFLIATVFGYLIVPDFANHKLYTLGGGVFFFWVITLLNTFGIRVSSFVSTLSAIIGILLPTALLICFGIFWVLKGSPNQLAPQWVPDFNDFSRWAFLTQIIISLIGIELSAVHAGDIQNPKRTIPKAFIYSSVVILFIVIAAPLSIGLVIPSQQISIVSGLVDALQIFFQSFHVPPFIFLTVLALVFIGNIGTVTGWMISSTRGMYVASKGCAMPSLFQLTNRYKAPLGILLLEAIIFTCLCGLFTLSSVDNIYWILLALGSQINLLYYVLIFISAIKLKKELSSTASSFCIPGGTKGTAVAAVLGSATCLLAIFFGFFPPSTGEVQEGAFVYPIALSVGILLSLAFPFILLKLSHKKSKDLA